MNPEDESILHIFSIFLSSQFASAVRLPFKRTETMTYTCKYAFKIVAALFLLRPTPHLRLIPSSRLCCCHLELSSACNEILSSYRSCFCVRLTSLIVEQ